MNVTITPKKLKGVVTIPPSKSLSHRSIIAASLADGISTISNIILSQDIMATIEAMRSFGASIEVIHEKRVTLVIKGRRNLVASNNEIYCNESGSTLRFLVPFFSLVDTEVIYTGRNKLVQRPLDPYYKIFKQQGITYKTINNELPLSVKGTLKPGIFEIDGDISSQFISGLMFVLPLLNGDSTIVINNTLESRSYVKLTINILKKFGIIIKNNSYKSFEIKGNQNYKPQNYYVEGDYSQSAFYIVGSLIGNDINILGLSKQSAQGDRVILDIVKKLGGDYSFYNGMLSIKAPKKFKSIKIDARDCPDLVPILGVLGSIVDKGIEIRNAQRLRLKESDRLNAISTELNKLGCNIIQKSDGLIINKHSRLQSQDVAGWNDHRIVMSLAIFSTLLNQPVTINGADAINKSYPGFFNDFVSLGGIINE